VDVEDVFYLVELGAMAVVLSGSGSRGREAEQQGERQPEKRGSVSR
jgi:hypothetical protein